MTEHNCEVEGCGGLPTIYTDITKVDADGIPIHKQHLLCQAHAERIVTEDMSEEEAELAGYCQGCHVKTGTEVGGLCALCANMKMFGQGGNVKCSEKLAKWVW